MFTTVLASAVIPLIYKGGLLYPYVTPKTLIFRTFGIAALGLLLYSLASNQRLYWGRLRSLSAWLPALLLIIAYSTSFIGVDFYRSFWSLFDRGDGLLTLTSIVLLYYCAVLFIDEGVIRKFFYWIAAMSGLVAFYAILQWAQDVVGVNLPIIEEPRGRYGGTFGNAAFLASYLGMTFFVTLASASDERHHQNRLVRLSLLLSLGLQLTAIILTATRGTMVAMIFIGIVVVMYQAMRGRFPINVIARVTLVVLTIIVTLFILFRARFYIPFEPVRRLVSISLNDTTTSSRLFAWQNILREAIQQPFRGYGAEHIAIIYNKVYDPSATIEQWFDRSHNAYLDYAVQFGFIGLAVYLLIIGSIIWGGWRLLVRRERSGAWMISLGFVYAIQNFFVFDTAASLWLLFMIFAISVYFSTRDVVRTHVRGSFHIPSIVALSLPLLVVLLFYPIVVKPLRANIALAEGYKYHVADVERSVNVMRRGLSAGTYADLEYGYQVYSMYTEQQQTLLQGAERVRAYEYAVEMLSRNFYRFQYDARTATYLALVIDRAPPEVQVDENFLRLVANRAIELSPKRAQAYYILANIPIKKGDQQLPGSDEQKKFYREAIDLLTTYSTKAPEFAEPAFFISNLAILVGEAPLAQQWANEGKRRYEQARYYSISDAARRAVRYYIAVKDWPNALRFLKELVSEDSKDYPQVYDLAKLYFLAGDRLHAEAIVGSLRESGQYSLLESDAAFMRAITSK